MTFKPTTQHLAIFDWVDNDNADAGHALIIKARAGSGKSTTLIEILRRLPVDKTASFLAFNKSAAVEIGAKAKRSGLDRSGIEFRTMHSAGFEATRNAFRGVRVDGNILRARVDEAIGDNFNLRRLLSKPVSDLVKAAKAQGFVPRGVKARPSLIDVTEAGWMDLVKTAEIEAPKHGGWQPALEAAERVLRLGLLNAGTVDFDDQLYLPFALGLSCRRFDWVLVDEAQDLNPVQRHLLRSMVADGGRIIAVGDDLQSIYGWRGADCDSLGAIGREYGATTLPLSVTYRCPTSVVAIAQKFAPDIEAAPNAKEGLVSTVMSTDGIEWRADDLVVCRNNAPLVSLAFALLRRRVPCKVAGRDIGKGIKDLVAKMRATSMVDLVESIVAYRAEGVAKATAAEDDAKAQRIADQCDTVLCLCDDVKTVDELNRVLDDIFSERVGVLTLSSVHRAKGAEAPRVFILRPDLMPSKYARTPDAKQQERNCQYVAVTRAIDELVFLATETPPMPAKAREMDAPCAVCGRSLTKTGDGKRHMGVDDKDRSVPVGPDCFKRVIAAGAEGLAVKGGSVWAVKP